MSDGCAGTSSALQLCAGLVRGSRVRGALVCSSGVRYRRCLKDADADLVSCRCERPAGRPSGDVSWVEVNFAAAPDARELLYGVNRSLVCIHTTNAA